MNATLRRNSPILSVAYMNIRGQTGCPLSKQVQIESFLRTYKPDIFHLQEIDVSEETFNSCH
jgi:hypothetical protein